MIKEFCERCKGRGKIEFIDNVFSHLSNCSLCLGKGYTELEALNVKHGLDIAVHKEMEDGKKYYFYLKEIKK